MDQKIAVSFPRHMVSEQRHQITDQVNKALESIDSKIMSWNGFVDFVETDPGDIQVIAKCDNEEIREEMQQLLNETKALFF